MVHWLDQIPRATAKIRVSRTLRRSSLSFCPCTKAERAKKNFASVGLAEWGEFRVGDALETLRVDPPREIDLILLVGAKSRYLDVLKLLEPQL
jgi:hypothetical protein